MQVHPFSHTAALIFHRSKKFVLKLNRKYNSGNNSSNNNSSCGKVNKRNQQDHDPDYLYKRGEVYLFGRAGEPKDEKKAFDYFQRASKLNHTEARGVLGFCYEFGLGVEKDFKRAELHYIPAAESGNGLAQARLAFLRKYGRPCVRIDRAEAEMWQQKVKEQGETAITWLFHAACNENHAAAQYSLGVCYHDGVGVDKSESEAFKWYKKSAEQGHPRGQGVEKNEYMAVNWYREAAAQEHARAQDKLGVCLQLGIGCEKDEKTALHYFRLAAEQDHLTAMYNLANALEKGIGCEIDFEGATHWLERAASSGCRRSCERLKTLLVKECLGQETSGNVYLTGYCAAAA
ncbi:HCP-like protein [Gigaspora margarita]|uniref:HCP-like protein n=1 Tax=Gigaspora margarita TaxID=4874 RepID=A0A8H4ARM6_GIGMA|nr:HCP-like protein [Gigaspora margarita]